MKYWVFVGVFICSGAMVPLFSWANMSDFSAGPVFESFGKHAPVSGIQISSQQKFKIAFDVAKGAEPGAMNRRFETLARFINMHVANGAKLENIDLALVVHGSATIDVMNNNAYKSRKGKDNDSKALLDALMSHGVRVIVCGQSAAANDVKKNMLIDGVEVDLSAMTAHARLNEEGYRVNPF